MSISVFNISVLSISVFNISVLSISEYRESFGLSLPFALLWFSLVAQLVKNPPALQETWVGFLGWEDPPEEGLTTHSSIMAWRIPWIV